MNSIQQFLRKPWLYLLIVLIGVSFKFYRLDYKFFWYDEVCTIAHTSGNARFSIPVNEIKNISYYRDQMHLNERDFTIGGQYQRLSKMVNLNPLHYGFLILWHRIIGDSPIHYRLFSVFVFLITLPLLFMLTRKLFQSNLAGWIAISLFSVLPFIQYYAQEARYYMLWAFMLIALHQLLLLAAENNSLKWWIAYMVIGILSLYTSVLSGLVIIAHGVYIFFFRKNARYHIGFASVIILLGYLPWILLMINNRSQIVESLAWTTSYGAPKIWQLFLAHVFATNGIISNLSDSGLLSMLVRNTLSIDNWWIILLDLLVVIITVLAIVHLFRKASREIAFFLLSAYLAGFIFIFISDIARGSHTSFILRYNMIQIISLLLIIVFYLYRKISESKILFTGIYIGLVVIGIISLISFTKKRCFINTSIMCRTEIFEAQLFSNAENPLVITDYNFFFNLGVGDFMTIINECESDSIDILYASPDIENVEKMISEKEYSDIYIVHASDALTENLKSQFEGRMDSILYEEPYPILKINL